MSVRSLMYETTEKSGPVCILCKKHYSSQSNLNRHLKEKHGLQSEVVIYDEQIKPFKCLEGCNFSFHKRSGLLYHLENRHNIPIEQEERQFSSRKEFLEWLESVENCNNVQYVRQSTSKKMDTVTVYYGCSRSGKPNNKQVSNERRRKSKKMDMPCTSGIKLVQSRSDGIKIKFYKTHYGHDFDVKHLRLLKEERMYVAQKLIEGLSPTEILDAIKETADSTKLRRIDLMTTKDIRNIRKNIKNGIHQCSFDVQQTKFRIKSETDCDICHIEMKNVELTESASKINSRLAESRSQTEDFDKSVIKSDSVPEVECQDSNLEDAVDEDITEANEMEESVMCEIGRLRSNIGQVSDTQVLKKVFEELQTLNLLLESESGGIRTLCEFDTKYITDQFDSTDSEMLVIQHDHGYT